jgi:hypothetical protein
MSSFFMVNIAHMTRPDFSGSGSQSKSGNTIGTTCHETPNLSFDSRTPESQFDRLTNQFVAVRSRRPLCD